MAHSVPTLRFKAKSCYVRDDELAMKGSGDEADEEEEELTQNLQTLT